jgi:hypothetical protein
MMNECMHEILNYSSFGMLHRTSGLVMYVDTKECHIQVRCTDNINTLIMLDSLENLYRME